MRMALIALLALTCGGEIPKQTRVSAPRAEFDIVGRGGDVLDGTGSPRVRADIGIRGDTIAQIGDLSNATAKTTIDASGKVVAPGFIDLLGNSQAAVLIDPKL